eukprot:gnl/TRDRNA2_/TRDRNA2_192768_c0_seq1.p1 gnl/TRDRNA2_/TRDRNA2_192768_c0~~gnl/TRDRNA2_/TRDRNA2_192768_c0_seq1.p1  ORF type:complete len:307 (+),score=33.23 gnl/TRDRNA2_/TRDRNA2_192768_c0_seq1:67-987(+)
MCSIKAIVLLISAALASGMLEGRRRFGRPDAPSGAQQRADASEPKVTKAKKTKNKGTKGSQRSARDPEQSGVWSGGRGPSSSRRRFGLPDDMLPDVRAIDAQAKEWQRASAPAGEALRTMHTASAPATAPRGPPSLMSMNRPDALEIPYQLQPRRREKPSHALAQLQRMNSMNKRRSPDKNDARERGSRFEAAFAVPTHSRKSADSVLRSQLSQAPWARRQSWSRLWSMRESTLWHPPRPAVLLRPQLSLQPRVMPMKFVAERSPDVVTVSLVALMGILAGSSVAFVLMRSRQGALTSSQEALLTR